MTTPSSDMKAFREIVKKSKHVVILTGAGISAESGVPTFRGAGGLWRKYQAQSLASPPAFLKNPGLVWEFYHYRRELVLTKTPNNAHVAIADFEKRMEKDGKKVVVITQNVDELHRRAGTDNIIELHGSLFKTICTECWREELNYDSPICEGLRGKGAPEADVKESKIRNADLPRCKHDECDGLLRPGVVWFGETLRAEVLEQAGEELEKCDLCLVVGTSSIVYPAAMFAPQVAARGVPVAEFNLESTPETTNFGYHFEGPCGTTLPEALAE
ncbi:unnamed protein product [Orchesella dallaii]|uniref:NAD-dependent protein deacylase n=1 Tax=Orchesella dallaii TaxID=48710 RepID=A0ABP1Q9H7_9HEXA